MSMAAQLQLFQTQDGSDRWTVRVSRRARRLSVRVYPGGRVEVVAPPGASATMVERFVGTHRQWIDRRVEDLSSGCVLADERRPSTIRLPAISQQYNVEYESRSGATVQVRADDPGLLVVRGPLHNEKFLAGALRQWLTALAQSELSDALREVSARCGLQFNRMQVRRQRTRWGSCSASGTISLNVCLLFLDPAVVRYLFVHELCHTRHMNHSARFWALVERHEPQYRQLDHELLRGWQSVPGWMFA